MDDSDLEICASYSTSSHLEYNIQRMPTDIFFHTLVLDVENILKKKKARRKETPKKKIGFQYHDQQRRRFQYNKKTKKKNQSRTWAFFLLLLQRNMNPYLEFLQTSSRIYSLISTWNYVSLKRFKTSSWFWNSVPTPTTEISYLDKLVWEVIRHDLFELFPVHNREMYYKSHQITLHQIVLPGFEREKERGKILFPHSSFFLHAFKGLLSHLAMKRIHSRLSKPTI